MKLTLILLTNFKHEVINELEEEDVLLASYLRNYFKVIVCHPLDCEKVEDIADLVLIRNIWPVFEYEEEWEEVKKRFLSKKLKVYPPLTAKGDMLGKDHLIELFNHGYPVIATVDDLKDIEKLPDSKFYFIKPKNKCDSIGAEKLTKEQLVKKKLDNYVIQPHIDFEYEVSFYVIDGEVMYAFSTSGKVHSSEIKEYQPTKADIEFVQKFIRWNDFPFGLQRVDACRTKEGNLLLIELEDFCPYLYLSDMEDAKRESFLKALVDSLHSLLKGNV